jgi:hypothetical protein
MRHPTPIGRGKHDRKVIAFVNSYWKTQFRPPTIREISTACGISSVSVTRYTLRRLANDGKYSFTEHETRGIVPVWVKTAIENYK